MEEFENLLNEDLSSDKANDLLLSNVYSVIDGGFEIEGVDTYLGSAQVSQLAEDIEIFEKLTENKSWPVSSIIQRDIDDRRVREIANDYILKSINNVKYFPPIVIAIVPRNENDEVAKEFTLNSNKNLKIHESIREKAGYSSKLKDAFAKSENKSSLDGLYVINFLQGLNQFPLSWDKEKIYAIVIDGQHRLEALKYAAKKKSRINKYKLDLVFLDLSRKAVKDQRSPVEAVRRIFIDINYNAKPVTNARRTLMDDKDLSALIVQSLVNDDDPNNERKGKFLAPQLVDWHSENLKHSFPQLTGVLVLQQLIEDNYLDGSNLSSFSDLRAPRKIGRFTNILNNSFLVDEKVKTKTKYEGIELIAESYKKYKDSIENLTDEDDKEDLLFNMDYNILNVARDSFEEYYAESIVTFFQKFLPYRKAIGILEEFQVFNKEDKRNRIIVKNPKKWSEEEKDLIDELQSKMHERLDPEFYLCYTVLGQKAFFRHYYMELTSFLSTKEPSNKEILDFTQKWLDSINSILNALSGFGLFSNDEKYRVSSKYLKEAGLEETGKIAYSFWQGIIYNENNIVYNTQGISGFMGVINYLYQVYQSKDNLNEGVLKAFENVWEKNGLSQMRIRRKIAQEYPDYDKNEIQILTDKIWRVKLKQLNSTILESL